MGHATQNFAPTWVVCVFMISNSSASAQPGFFRSTVLQCVMPTSCHWAEMRTVSNHRLRRPISRCRSYRLSSPANRSDQRCMDPFSSRPLRQKASVKSISEQGRDFLGVRAGDPAQNSQARQTWWFECRRHSADCLHTVSLDRLFFEELASERWPAGLRSKIRRMVDMILCPA